MKELDMVVEIMEVAGSGIVVGMGEVVRRAILGRRLEQNLAKERSTGTWRVLRTEADVRDALDRALASEQRSIQQCARRAQRYEAMRSDSQARTLTISRER
jgi:hypothetical protein